jgi:hypothetical protein
LHKLKLEKKTCLHVNRGKARDFFSQDSDYDSGTQQAKKRRRGIRGRIDGCSDEKAQAFKLQDLFIWLLTCLGKRPKKKKMELLEDKNVFDEYITHVMNLVPPPYNKEIDRKTLKEFVVLRSKDNESFPIPLTYFAKWLWPDLKRKAFRNKRDLIKNLLLSENTKFPIYKEGIDFVELHILNQETRRTFTEYFLSSWCFGELCLRMESKRSLALRYCLLAIEEAYRDFAGETIKERRKHENPIVSKKKQTTLEYFKVPKKPLLYWQHFEQFNPLTGEKEEFEKFGGTKTGNTRLQKNKLQFGGDSTIRKIEVMETPAQAFAAEATLKALTEEYGVPCQHPPCPTEIPCAQKNKPFHPELAWKVAIEAQDWARKRLESLEARKPKMNDGLLREPHHLSFRTKRGGVKMIDLQDGSTSFERCPRPPRCKLPCI